MTTTQTRAGRFAFGRQILDSIDGTAGRNVIDSLADVAPELGHQIVAWAFGDMYSRPQLEPKQRQLVTSGVLTVLGGCEAQLDVHVNAALNVGLTTVEIIETITHASVYCGMPRALNAIGAAEADAYAAIHDNSFVVLSFDQTRQMVALAYPDLDSDNSRVLKEPLINHGLAAAARPGDLLHPDAVVIAQL